MKLPTALVIKMNVFVLPDAAAKGATAARQRMFLIEAFICALMSCMQHFVKQAISDWKCLN